MKISKKYLKRSFGTWGWTMALLWLFKFIPFSLTDLVGPEHKIPTEPYDLYAQYEAKASVSVFEDRIVIVKIPDSYGRDEIAATLENLKQCNPAVIGLDFLFPDKKEAVSDQRLAQAVEAFDDKIVLATLYDESTGNLMRSYFAEEIGEYEGCTNPDVSSRYDILRTFIPEQEYGNKIFPSLAYAISCLYPDSKYDNSYKVGERAYIYWKSVKFSEIDACDVLEQKDNIEGKIVLVGVVSDEIDVHRTSISSDYSGVKVIAHMVCNLIDNDFIWHSWWCDILVCALILLVCAFIMQYFECKEDEQGEPDERYSDFTDVVSLILQLGLLIGVVVFLGYYMYKWGVYIDFTILLLGIIVMPIINDFYNAGKHIYDIIEKKFKNKISK